MTRSLPFPPLRRLPLVLAGVTLLAVPLLGADDEDEREPYGISVRVGGLAWFNAKASLTDTRPTLGGTGNFNDGFVLPRTTQGTNQYTWNWGYENAAQVSGGQLELHRLDNSPRVGNFELSGDNPLLGGELVIALEAFRFELGRRDARFGVEFGYGYLPYSASGGASRSGTASYTTARHNFAPGVIPPMPPYAGTPDGPGPLLELNPASTATESSTGTSEVTSSFDVTLHALRFGFWVDYPLTDRISLTASLGYSAVYADGEISVTESLTFANPLVPSLASSTAIANKTDWLQGAYLQVRGSWRFTEHWSVFLGGEARWQTDFEIQAPDRRAELEFGVGFGAVAGIEFSF